MRGCSHSSPRALVLTAGLGTRLRPLTYIRAKAAIPINGEPLVRRVIRWLSAHGIHELVLNLHHHPHTITSVVGDGADLGVRVRYSWEQPVLGPAGGPRRALPLLADDEDEPFLLVNGDTLTDLDPRLVVTEHVRSGALVTMALIRNPKPEKYGGVAVDGDGWIVGFTTRGVRETFHFIGIQAAVPRAFASLEDGLPAQSVGGLYSHLIAEKTRSIRAFVCDAGFQDIGTPGDCLDTSLLLADLEGDRLVNPGAAVDPSAQVARTAIWEDVMVGANAQLIECIVGDGIRIPSGAHYERCAIVPAGGHAAAPGEYIDGELLIRPF